ncbi:MAG: hypothetical protein IJD13_02855, partial [Oscillospiraceae bacterium]|nr:hypothetical protein [Oscillospiraceae bacterium]
MKKLTLPSSCKEFLSVWIVTVPAAVLTLALTVYPAKKLAQHPADQTAITFFDLLLPVLAAGIISLAAIAAVTLMVFLLRRKKDAPALPEKARFRPCERLGIRLSLIILTVFTTVFFGADELLTSTLSIRHFRKGSIFWAQTFHECLFWCSLIFLLGYIVCAVRTAAGGYTRTLLWTTAACNIAAVGIIFYLYIGVEEPFGRFRSNEYLYMGMLLDSQNLFKPFLAAVLYTADIFIVLYKIYRSYDDSFPYIRRSPDLKTLCGLLITVALFAAFVTPFA